MFNCRNQLLNYRDENTYDIFDYKNKKKTRLRKRRRNISALDQLHELTIVSYVQHTNLKVHSHEYHLSTNGLNARCARGRSFRVKQKKEGWYSLRHMPLLHLAECIGTRYNWEYPRRNAQRKGTSYSAGYGHTLAPISLLTLFD